MLWWSDTGKFWWRKSGRWSGRCSQPARRSSVKLQPYMRKSENHLCLISIIYVSVNVVNVAVRKEVAISGKDGKTLPVTAVSVK